jgi:MFS family permease
MTVAAAARNRPRSATAFIVLMGVVAMFGDMTYEGGRGLVGPYLALLGASATAVGFAAGFGEFLGYGLRLLTGWLGDRTRAYWPLIIGGYALNLVAVPGLALVGSWQGAVALLLLERIAKAVRSPARSTLVSFAAREVGVGKGFGIDEALDQLGAVSGPLLTALAIWVLRAEPVSAQYRWAFAVLLLPVIGNLGCVLWARHWFPSPESFETRRAAEQVDLGGLFRWYMLAVMLLGLGFADWALIAYHLSTHAVFDLATLPLVYAGAMAVDAVAALAFGALFDLFGVGMLGVSTLLSIGFVPLLFWGVSGAEHLLGALCWAIGMGAQDSIFKAAIALLVDKARRSRAYGIFFALFGLAWWIGSTFMGWLYGRSLTGLVVFSVSTQLLAVPLFFVIGRKLKRAPA